MIRNENTRRGQGFADKSQGSRAKAAKGQVQFGTKAAFDAPSQIVGNQEVKNLSIANQVDSSNPYPFLAGGLNALGKGIEKGNAKAKADAAKADGDWMTSIQNDYAKLIEEGKTTEAEQLYRNADLGQLTSDASKLKFRNMRNKTIGLDASVKSDMMDRQSEATAMAAKMDDQALAFSIENAESIEERNAAVAEKANRAQVLAHAQKQHAGQQATVQAVDYVLEELDPQQQLALMNGDISFMDVVDDADLPDAVKSAAIANWASIGHKMTSDRVYGQLTQVDTEIGTQAYNAAVESISNMEIEGQQFGNSVSLMQGLAANTNVPASQRVELLSSLVAKAENEGWEASHQIRDAAKALVLPIMGQQAKETVESIQVPGQPTEQVVATTEGYVSNFNHLMHNMGMDIRMGNQDSSADLYELTTASGGLLNPDHPDYDFAVGAANSVMGAHNKSLQQGGTVGMSDKWIDMHALYNQDTGSTSLQESMTGTQYNQEAAALSRGERGNLPASVLQAALDLGGRMGMTSPDPDTIRAAVLMDAFRRSENSSDPEGALARLTDEDRSGAMSTIATLGTSSPATLGAMFLEMNGTQSFNALFAGAMADGNLTTTERRSLHVTKSILGVDPSRFVNPDGQMDVNAIREAYREQELPTRAITATMINAMEAINPQMDGRNTSANLLKTWTQAEQMVFDATGSGAQTEATPEQTQMKATYNQLISYLPQWQAEIGMDPETPMSNSDVEEFFAAMADFNAGLAQSGGAGAAAEDDPMTVSIFKNATLRARNDAGSSIMKNRWDDVTDSARFVDDWSRIRPEDRHVAAMMGMPIAGLGKGVGLHGTVGRRDQERLLTAMVEGNELKAPHNMGPHTSLLDVAAANGLDLEYMPQNITMDVADEGPGGMVHIAITDSQGESMSMAVPSEVVYGGTSGLQDPGMYSTSHYFDEDNDYNLITPQPFNTFETLKDDAVDVEPTAYPSIDLDYDSERDGDLDSYMSNKRTTNLNIAREQTLAQYGPGRVSRMDEFIYFPVAGQPMMVTGYKRSPGQQTYRPVGDMRKSDLGDAYGEASTYEIRGKGKSRVVIPRAQGNRNAAHLQNLDAFLKWNSSN